MRAQLSTWLIGSIIGSLVAVTGLAACGDDDDVVGDPEVRAAEALARAMHFTGGELRDGTMGLATEDRVEVLLASEQVVQPGGADLMPLEVDNPIEDENPEVALLMQFDDAKQHARVPVKKSVNGPGDLNFEFDVDEGICAGLCASIIHVGVTLALELEDGISKHTETSIAVNCKKLGDPKACSDDGKPGSPGGGDGGISSGNAGKGGSATSGSSGGARDGGVSVSPGATAAVDELLTAVDDFDSELCACLSGAQATTCVSGADAQRSCNEVVLLAFAEGNSELLHCTAMYFDDQYECVANAGCDTTKLEACTATSTTETMDNWAAIEAACGTVPAALRSGIDACGSGTGTLQCPDGTALTPADLCDDIEDCDDGSDELGCGDPGVPGRPTSFPCTNGSVITLDKACDGTMDCPDGFDEMVCTACLSGGGQYSPFDACDGKNACSDGTDENGCNYPCTNGAMVLITLACNGTDDCGDNSDEAFCNGGSYPCASGEMIAISKLCDGTVDCSDGGDENPALCMSM